MVATVLGHTAIVNCVCWVPPAHFGAVPGGTSAALLASGAADNTVRLWLWQPQSPEPWRPLAVLEVGWHAGWPAPRARGAVSGGRSSVW